MGPHNTDVLFSRGEEGLDYLRRVFEGDGEDAGHLGISSQGTKVPPCPALSRTRSLLIQATTSWLVGPGVLSMFMIPNLIRSLRGRSSGGQPYSGSVSSSSFMTISLFSSQGGIVAILTLQ